MERHHWKLLPCHIWLENLFAVLGAWCLGFRRNQGMIGQGGPPFFVLERNLEPVGMLEKLGMSQASTSIVNSSTKPKLLRKDHPLEGSFLTDGQFAIFPFWSD